METKNYDGMGIFQEAKQREIDGMGYRARRFKIVWQSNKVSWQHLMIEWGIRWSDKWQFLPIRNVSDNCHIPFIILKSDGVCNGGFTMVSYKYWENNFAPDIHIKRKLK